MLDVLLNVLAVIGIIVVGGFVVVFLGNLLLNVLDSESKAKKEKHEEAEVQPEQITYTQTQAQAQPQQLNYVEPEQTQEYTDVDLQKANEEEAALNAKNLDDAYAKLKAEEEAFRLEREKFIEEQKKAQEQTAKVEEDTHEETEEPNAEETEEEKSSEKDDDIDLDDIFFDEDEEIVEEPKEEDKEEKPEEEAQEQEEQPEETEKTSEEVETTEDEETETPSEEVEEVAPIDDERVKELRRAQEAEDKLNEENAETEASDANLTLEEYEQRLETLTQRLKDNDKQLKAVKKEYLPLARVRKSLENDQKKLRRRESIVAKQRVVLYGVNNFGDIDEEKAKKLEEDQELLDGLKASVAHCEEILDKNKDRLPILENTYNILVENSNNLKADIEETNAKIEELKKASFDGDADSSDTSNE